MFSIHSKIKRKKIKKRKFTYLLFPVKPFIKAITIKIIAIPKSVPPTPETFAAATTKAEAILPINAAKTNTPKDMSIKWSYEAIIYQSS